jgi:hypothetical protein
MLLFWLNLLDLAGLAVAALCIVSPMLLILAWFFAGIAEGRK